MKQKLGFSAEERTYAFEQTAAMDEYAMALLLNLSRAYGKTHLVVRTARRAQNVIRNLRLILEDVPVRDGVQQAAPR